jgi:hypothetical protein
MGITPTCYAARRRPLPVRSMLGTSQVEPGGLFSATGPVALRLVAVDH